MLLCKSKGRRKKQEQRKRNRERRAELSGAAKEDKGNGFLGWGTCDAKERKDHDPPFQLLAFILFTPHNSIF